MTTRPVLAEQLAAAQSDREERWREQAQAARKATLSTLGTHQRPGSKGPRPFAGRGAEPHNPTVNTGETQVEPPPAIAPASDMRGSAPRPPARVSDPGPDDLQKRSGFRRNAIFEVRGTAWRALDRNQRVRIWTVAQTLEAKTKAKGRKIGRLGATGLLVLHALLFRFHNSTSGRCDPSYDALQRVTGFCRQTITDAIDRIEAAGLVSVTRRMMRFHERVGNVVAIVVRQISNAYHFTDALPATLPITTGGTARPFPTARQPKSLLESVVDQILKHRSPSDNKPS